MYTLYFRLYFGLQGFKKFEFEASNQLNIYNSFKMFYYCREKCESRGCIYEIVDEEGGAPWCYYPTGS